MINDEMSVALTGSVDTFIGQVSLPLSDVTPEFAEPKWYKLTGRGVAGEKVTIYGNRSQEKSRRKRRKENEKEKRKGKRMEKEREREAERKRKEIS